MQKKYGNESTWKIVKARLVIERKINLQKRNNFVCFFLKKKNKC